MTSSTVSRVSATSATATIAPSAARRRTIAWPMPEAPPVTSATLPSCLAHRVGALFSTRYLLCARRIVGYADDTERDVSGDARDHGRRCAEWGRWTMRYRRLDLNLLLALDVLLAERSVTRAAAKLNVTQPAMSGSLARLRDYFEDALIVQVGRTMELTPLAEALVAPVRDIMTRIDAAISTDPQFDPSTSKRRFSITASDYVLRVLLLDVMREVRKHAPSMTFDIHTTTPRGGAELESGELDMMIIPETMVLDEHPHELLFE